MVLTSKIKTRIFYASVAVGFLLFIGFCLTVRNQLEQNHLISYGSVYEVRRTGRANLIRLAYECQIDNKTYKSDIEYSGTVISLEDSKVFEGKSFPVVYYPKFPHLNTMLVLPKDFEQFNIPFPDSLKWVLPLIKK